MAVPQPIPAPVPAPPPRVRLLHPPSAEQRFWARVLPLLFAPGDGRGNLLTRAWGVFSVAPFAHVTFFSLAYQTYLYDVFHQSRVARLGHFVCMPVINLMAMVVLAVAFPAAAPVEGLGLLAPDGALAYAVLLLTWYLAWAVAERFLLWGAVMVPVVLALYVGARAWAALTLLPEPAARTWWAAAPLALNPLLWMGVFSFLQALSHATEPRLPPRVSMCGEWLTVGEFVRGPAHAPHAAGQRLVRSVRAAAQLLYGTLDELWASPRLLPLNFLELMWRRGYQAPRFRAWNALTLEALADGNPALDFIGTGGGAFLPDTAP